MGLFTRNKSKAEVHIPPTPKEREVTIEIVANKNARQEVIEQAKKAQELVDGLLEENHFHIKMFVGVGGKRPTRKRA